MLKQSAMSLRRKPKWFRFVYFIVSGVRFTSYRTWSEAGEPNPFVSLCHTARRSTSRQEVIDVFGADLH